MGEEDNQGAGQRRGGDGKFETKLSPQVRRFIVEELACYEPPKDVLKSLRERFKELFAENREAVDTQAIRAHDPTKARGAGLSKALKEHFYEVRRLFDEESKKQSFGSVTGRISMRRVLIERALAKGDDRAARELLNDIAMEQGGKFTNQKVHSGSIEVAVEDKRKALAATMLAKRLLKGMTYEAAKKELVGLGVNERDIPDIGGE